MDSASSAATHDVLLKDEQGKQLLETLNTLIGADDIRSSVINFLARRIHQAESEAEAVQVKVDSERVRIEHSVKQVEQVLASLHRFLPNFSLYWDDDLADLNNIDGGGNGGNGDGALINKYEDETAVPPASSPHTTTGSGTTKNVKLPPVNGGAPPPVDSSNSLEARKPWGSPLPKSRPPPTLSNKQHQHLYAGVHGVVDTKVGETKSHSNSSPRRLRKTKSRGGGSTTPKRSSRSRGAARDGGMKMVFKDLHDLGDRLSRLVPPKFNVPAREKEAEARTDVIGVMRALAVGVTVEEHNARVEQLERSRRDAKDQSRGLAAELAKSKRELAAANDRLEYEQMQRADEAAAARKAAEQVQNSLKLELLQARSATTNLEQRVLELERKFTEEQQKNAAAAADAAAADADVAEFDSQSAVSGATTVFAEGLEDAVIIFAVGGADSGVSSLCERAAADFDLNLLRVADLIEAEIAAGTELGEEMLASLTSGKFITSTTLVDLVLKNMKATLVKNGFEGRSNNEITFVIEGFPTNTDQALAFEEATMRKPALTVGVMDASMQASESAVLEMYSRRAETSEADAGRHRSIIGGEDIAEDEAYGALRDALTDIRVRRADQRLGDLTVVPVIGSGSGSGGAAMGLCERIAAEYGFEVVSLTSTVEDEVHAGTALGRECVALLSHGKMLPNDLCVRAVKAALLRCQGDRVLLEGFPSGREQSEAMRAALGIAPDFALCLVDHTMTRQEKETAEYYLNEIGVGVRVDVADGTETAYRQIRTTMAEHDVGLSEARLADCTLIVAIDGSDGFSSEAAVATGFVDRAAADYGATVLSLAALVEEEMELGSEEGVMAAGLLSQGKILPPQLHLALVKRAMLRPPVVVGSGSDDEGEGGNEGGANNNNVFIIEGFPRSAEHAAMLAKEIAEPAAALCFLNASTPPGVSAAVEAYRGSGVPYAIIYTDDIKSGGDTEENVYESDVVPVLDAAGIERSAARLGDLTIVATVTDGTDSSEWDDAVLAAAAERYGFLVLDLDDIISEEIDRGTEEGAAIHSVLVSGGGGSGKLVPPGIIATTVKRALLRVRPGAGGDGEEGGRVMLRGFPRSLEQAKALEAEIGLIPWSFALVFPFSSPAAAATSSAVSAMVQGWETAGLVRHVSTGKEVDAVFAREDILPSSSKLAKCELKVVLGGGGSDGGGGGGVARAAAEIEAELLSISDLVGIEADLGSEVGATCDGLLSSGKILPASMSVELVRRAMLRSPRTSFVLHGFPRSSEQANALLAGLPRGTLRAVLCLEQTVEEGRALDPAAAAASAAAIAVSSHFESSPGSGVAVKHVATVGDLLAAMRE